jgi:hypothetical protein
MKSYGERTLLAFDWFATFFERAVPKYPEPKRPAMECIARAAEAAYNADPSAVPYHFVDGRSYVGMPKHVHKELVIRAVMKDMHSHLAGLRQYILKEYNVLVAHQDGRKCKGICIIPNNHKGDHVEAVQAQAAWGHNHCVGAHESEDFMAQHMNRLQPKAQIQRHRLVNIPLPKPADQKKKR